VIITASSVYTALKLGALPWPIFFVVLLALFALKLLARLGRATNINEANVSATMMSAGAMVAGGLAFTIPGIYILDSQASLSLPTVIICAACGVALGCVGTALFRKHFIIQSRLPYPVGSSAAQTLRAADSGGRGGILLLISALFAGLVAIARDLLSLLPSMLLSWVRIPGVSFGIYFSPMALGMGFLIAPAAALAWILGGLIGDFALVVGGVGVGLWELAQAQDMKTSLGIGVMIGCGVGLVIKVLAKAAQAWHGTRAHAANNQVPPEMDGLSNGTRAHAANNAHAAKVASAPTLASATSLLAETTASAVGPVATQATVPAPVPSTYQNQQLIKTRWAVVVVAAVVLALCLAGGVSPLAATGLAALVWLAMAMSAQCTGQAGLNPMEVFGIIVVLIIALFAQLGNVEAFLVAAVATVACGFVGDMTNDFQAGKLLNTNPKAQWFAECIGGFIGAIVAALVLALLVSAYGSEAFGSQETFVAAQATAVAAMVGAIPHMPAFCLGLAVGLVLYMAKAPVITLGLGIYLPFYLSLTVAVGAILRLLLGLFFPTWSKTQDPMVLASGLLAGESIAGVLAALVTVFWGLGAQ
jgi:uncharacterized oligopeptide transporter (OPT) family protein